MVQHSDSDFDKALRLASSLSEILESEFDALRRSDLDTFEALQTDKLTILQDLASTEVVTAISETSLSAASTQFDLLNDSLNNCKIKFQRNDLLINKKIESVKAALNTLRHGSNSQPLELYDKLGIIKNDRGIR